MTDRYEYCEQLCKCLIDKLEANDDGTAWEFLYSEVEEDSITVRKYIEAEGDSDDGKVFCLVNETYISLPIIYELDSSGVPLEDVADSIVEHIRFMCETDNANTEDSDHDDASKIRPFFLSSQEYKSDFEGVIGVRIRGLDGIVMVFQKFYGDDYSDYTWLSETDFNEKGVSRANFPDDLLQQASRDFPVHAVPVASYGDANQLPDMLKNCYMVSNKNVPGFNSAAGIIYDSTLLESTADINNSDLVILLGDSRIAALVPVRHENLQLEDLKVWEAYAEHLYKCGQNEGMALSDVPYFYSREDGRLSTLRAYLRDHEIA